jgi:hypothetical protein
MKTKCEDCKTLELIQEEKETNWKAIGSLLGIINDIYNDKIKINQWTLTCCNDDKNGICNREMILNWDEVGFKIPE